MLPFKTLPFLLSSSSSLMSRYEKFVGSSKLKKAKKSKGTRKEAAKVLEYTTTVERALQAAEILQATQQAGEQTRREMLREAGLVEACDLICCFVVLFH